MEQSGDRSETTDEASVLLLFGGALGDFLCLLPGLCSLRRQNQGRITVVAQPAFLELIDREKFGAVSIDRREIADLFATDPIRGSTFDSFGGFSTVHSWVGHGDDNFVARLEIVSGGIVHIHQLRGMKPREHASEYLARCLGVRAGPTSLVPPAEAVAWAADLWERHGLSDPTLIVHAGSGSPTKNWQGMATIAQRWRTERHGSVLLLCGPAEQAVDVPHDVVVREPSLNLVVALLMRAAGYLGNDSGISHLAGLAGAVGVVAFGPSEPRIWHPLGDGLRVCRAESTTCRRCGSFCTHILRIEEVWAALSNRTQPSPSQTARKQG